MHKDIKKIDNEIEGIRNNIYNYNLNEMFSDIDSLISEISNWSKLKEISKDKINIFNTILENVNISIQNKDYQLLADILKFQLKDFIENI